MGRPLIEGKGTREEKHGLPAAISNVAPQSRSALPTAQSRARGRDTLEFQCAAAVYAKTPITL
jgi:hypothetical protein